MAVASNGSNISVLVNQRPRVIVNQSGLITRRLADLQDVDISAKTDGSLLIYDGEREKFVTATILEKQEINGGHF
jgi:hypothetical protein